MKPFLGMPIILHRYRNPDAQALAGFVTAINTNDTVNIFYCNEFGSPCSQTSVVFSDDDELLGQQDYCEPNPGSYRAPGVLDVSDMQVLAQQPQQITGLTGRRDHSVVLDDKPSATLLKPPPPAAGQVDQGNDSNNKPG